MALGFADWYNTIEKGPTALNKMSDLEKSDYQEMYDDYLKNQYKGSANSTIAQAYTEGLNAPQTIAINPGASNVPGSSNVPGGSNTAPTKPSGPSYGYAGSANDPKSPYYIDPYQGLPSQEAAKLRAYENARNRDLAIGKARGELEFGHGSLGRVDAGRSQDIANILAQRKLEAQGFTPDEINAYKAQFQTPASQALQGQMRDLQRGMANAGIRGGAATAQQNFLVQQANKANVANARDIYLANIAQKRAGLSAYEQALRDTEASELSKQQYNIGREALEKSGRLATEYGFASLGAAERSGVAQQMSAEKYGQAMQAAQSGGKK